MKTLLAMTTLLTVACTPITERERDIREYRRIDFQAKYMEFQSRCRAKGRIVLVTSTSAIRRNGLPGPSDTYRCM